MNVELKYTMLNIVKDDTVYLLDAKIGGNVIPELPMTFCRNPVDAILIGQHLRKKFEDEGKVIDMALVRMKIEEITEF